jgi:UDP-glucose 4-epimerase
MQEKIMNNVSGSNVLITGGLGFIGSNLARKLLSLGANVTLVDSLLSNSGANRANIADLTEKLEIFNVDIRDANKLPKLLDAKDVVFNLASHNSHSGSMVQPHLDLSINTEGLLNILDICKSENPHIKIVQGSTRQIYGQPDYLPVCERHPVRPIDVNAINKIAAEHYVELYNKVYGLNTTCLRLTNTYGPGMRVKDAKQNFLGIWVKSVLSGETFDIFGNGDLIRDFNFVDDCCDAFILCAYSDITNGKTYNLGSGEPIDLNALALLLTQLGYGGSYRKVPLPASRKAIDIGSYYADISFIQAELKWFPKFSLRHGLLKTLDYYDVKRDSYW